jgi:hypothetical protein
LYYSFDKDSHYFQMRVLLAITISAFVLSSAYGTYVEVKLGKTQGAVYLKSGRVDFAYEFDIYGDDDTHDRSDGGVGLTVFVADSTGATLFRNTIPGGTGWYHASFNNPADGYVRFWGKGIFKINTSGVYILHDNTTITGGDTPPATSQIAAVPPPTAAGPSPAPTPVAPPRPTEIHAVIISGQSDPAKILHGNVHLVGGLIALGREKGATPGTWDPGVKITPDAELLTGQKVPPVTPNLIDVRITRYEISATLDAPPATGK